MNEKLEEEIKAAERDKYLAETKKALSEGEKINFELQQIKADFNKPIWRRSKFWQQLFNVFVGIGILGFYINYLVIPMAGIENRKLEKQNLDWADSLQKQKKNLNRLIFINDTIRITLTRKNNEINELVESRNKLDSSFQQLVKDNSKTISEKATIISKINTQLTNYQKLKRAHDMESLKLIEEMNSLKDSTSISMPHIYITSKDLEEIAGNSSKLIPGIAEWVNKICPTYGIDNLQEYAHFLAQACHETDRFKTLKEYASGQAYEGRADLGNTNPGDGVKYKGRGIFEKTGRANYLQLGIIRGERDLFINNPELLEQPEYAVWVACEFWKTRGLNDIANHADEDVLKKKYRGNVIDVSPIEYISITINGGYGGMDERKKYYYKAVEVLGKY